MQTSIERVIHLLDHTPRSALAFDELVAALDDLRIDVLEEARELGRTRSTLQALERESTRARDGDPFQNRAIAVVKGIDRDLRSLIERESAVRRVFGRGYRDEFAPLAHRIDELRASLVDNRQAGSRAASPECLRVAQQAEALIRQITCLEKERRIYSASVTLAHGLIILSMLHDPYGEGGEGGDKAA
ncbi:MAG: hypothetical protein AAGD33_06080 [Actinomycetota bacterium]